MSLSNSMSCYTERSLNLSRLLSIRHCELMLASSQWETLTVFSIAGFAMMEFESQGFVYIACNPVPFLCYAQLWIVGDTQVLWDTVLTSFSQLLCVSVKWLLDEDATERTVTCMTSPPSEGFSVCLTEFSM